MTMTSNGIGEQNHTTNNMDHTNMDTTNNVQTNHTNNHTTTNNVNNTTNTPKTERNLIVVSNRLPLSIKKVADGSYRLSLSSGGLVTALSGLTQTRTFRWFGWPGLEPQDAETEKKVSAALAEHRATAIFLDKQLADEHYNGFCNSILWPILHYQSGVDFKDTPWEAYEKVNSIFADVVSAAAETGDLIWVHDYHLMLLPGLLRERLAKQGKRCPIGFSLHTPFPQVDFWRALPPWNRLLEGIVASDLVGFHTDEYKRYFAECCAYGLGTTTNPQHTKIQHRDSNSNPQKPHRETCIGKFIVGIQPRKFSNALQHNTRTRERIKQLQDRYADTKVIIGVDRLDHIKNLKQKLLGFDNFLSSHPELKQKVVLIQIAVPSRQDVREYQELEMQVNMLVGKICGKHATPDKSPLIYIHRPIPFDELTALYYIADVCLLTSRRDGMNLVAFEYVACQAERHGVLALSELAGAASFMGPGSVPFHPSSEKALAQAIYTAVTMDAKERRWKYEYLRDFVNTHTSAKWGEAFIEALGTGSCPS